MAAWKTIFHRPLEKDQTTTITDLPRSNNSTHVKSFIQPSPFQRGRAGGRVRSATTGGLPAPFKGPESIN